MIMDSESVHVYPNAGNNDVSTLALLAAMNGGGFGGGMNNPLWMMFMYPFIMPFMSMFGGWGNGGFGGFGFGGNNGTGFLANQLNNDAGREVIMQAINGRADALGQLAQITHTSVESVRDAISTMNTKLSEVGAQVGMSGLQVINSVQAGNASIAKQLCECCCENRLATANQTAALQSSIAAHDANVRLQLSQNEAADQLAVCQQTNQLGSQADRNTNSILGAIASQNAMLEQRFCEIKEREMQSKIDTQADIITQLRNQNAINALGAQNVENFRALETKINAIAAKQPNTVPVEWPNLVAANATPYVGGYGYGFGNGFGNGVIL